MYNANTRCNQILDYGTEIILCFLITMMMVVVVVVVVVVA
jgi:hypothetical protein